VGEKKRCVAGRWVVIRRDRVEKKRKVRKDLSSPIPIQKLKFV
jgi:hypothetical protein